MPELDRGDARRAKLFHRIARNALLDALVDCDEELAVLSAQVLLRGPGGLAGLHTTLSGLLASISRDHPAHIVTAAVGVAEAVLHSHRHIHSPGRSPARVGTVLLMTPTEEVHRLGAQAVALQLRAAGVEVRMLLGLAWADLGDAVQVLQGPVVVAASLRTPPALRPAREGVALLRERFPAVRVVLGGDPEMATERLAGAVHAHGVAHDVPTVVEALRLVGNPLTPREREVLSRVAEGLSNAEVAAHLGTSTSTVKTHLDRSFAKLAVRDRAEAVAVALRRDLF